jgi:hypothetical protein
MWQRLALRRGGYYHLCVLAAVAAGACAPGPAPLAPEELPQISRAEVSAWVDGYAPTQAQLYDLRWTYETQKGKARGRAAVRFVPPDSIRFDYRGPFGRSGAAMVVGERVVWAEPDEDAGGFMALAPLFWMALGVPQDPPSDAVLSGREEGTRRLWRYATGLDTLTYRSVRASPATLAAEMRHGRELLGTGEVELADSTGLPEKATMLFPGSATAIYFTVRAIEPITSVETDFWQRP